MINAQEIKPDMPVFSKDGQFGVVDHLEGSDTIKLKRDESGEHHFIPLSWVDKVDSQVHVGRSRDQIMKEWKTEGSKTH